MAVVLETSHQKRHCCYPTILNTVFLTLAIGRMATVRHSTNWTILQTLWPLNFYNLIAMGFQRTSQSTLSHY